MKKGFKPEPKNHSEVSKNIILYCFNTENTTLLKQTLSQLGNSQFSFQILLNEKLQGKELELNQNIEWVNEIKLFEIIAQNPNAYFVAFDCNNINKNFAIEAWLKKALKNDIDNKIILPELKKVGLKEKLNSELRFALTHLDTNSSFAPAAILPINNAANILFQTQSLAEALVRAFRLNVPLQFVEGDFSFETKSKNIANAAISTIPNWWKWSFVQPFQEAKVLKNEENSHWRFVYHALLLVLFFVMPIASQYFAISGDEYIHHKQAEYVYNYFQTGDETALNQPKTLLHLYGQSFDLICYYFIQWFDIENVYEFRHFMNALFGFLGVFFVGYTASRFGGYLLGTVAILLITFSPVYFGHAMNNPMDIPFAAAFIMGIYYISKVVKHYPVFRWSHVFMIALSIGLAISLRIGGILLIPYMIMMFGLVFIEKIGLKNLLNFSTWKPHLRLIYAAVLATAIGYFLGILPWPYALQDPLANPKIALESFTNIETGINQLFEGKNIQSQNLPKHYLSKFIFITIPIAVILGVVLFFLGLFKNYKNQALTQYFFAFASFFPVVYIAYQGSNVYGGWRHVLFIYPPLILVSAIGWKFLMEIANKKAVKIAGFVIMLGLLALPARYMFANFPMHYIYFNETVGGLNKAYKNYETDYYANAILPLCDWLKNHEEFKNTKDTILITTNFGSSVTYYFRDYKHVKVRYSRYYNKSEQDWDYGIFYKGYIDDHQLNNGLWPTPGHIFVYNVDNAPMGAVVKRPSKEDKLGFDAFKQRRYQDAVGHFKNYLAINPKSEEVNAGLANAYLFSDSVSKALETANKSLEMHPDYLTAWDIKGRALLNLGRDAEAQQAFQRGIQLKVNYDAGYYFLAAISYNQKQFDTAINYLNQCLGYNQNFGPAYQLAGACFQMKGDMEKAKLYFDKAKQLGM